MAKKTGRKRPPKRRPNKRRIETPTRTRGRSKAAAVETLPALDDPGKAELSLLAVLADPANFRATNEQLWQQAQISRATFYRLMRDPSFMQRRRQVLFHALRATINEVLGDTIASAKLPGKAGHADRRILLEIAGVYQPAQRHVEVKAAMAEGDLPDEELVYMYLAAKLPREHWIPGVRARYEQKLITPRPPAGMPGSAIAATQGAPL